MKKINEPIEKFKEERLQAILKMSADEELRDLTQKWILKASEYKYTFNFSWLGRPIIQLPTDIVAMQEIIWQTKPEVIIETGIAHGGSIIFYASMMEIIGKGEVIGIDIDVRAHNRVEIEKHPMMKRITIIEGSSIDDNVVQSIKEKLCGRRTMVVLDSCHTHDHVLKELELYSPFVSPGCYLVVMDTVVEFQSSLLTGDSSWGIDNNPYTAVHKFLLGNDNFLVDKSIENKLLFTCAPHGFLLRRM